MDLVLRYINKQLEATKSQSRSGKSRKVTEDIWSPVLFQTLNRLRKSQTSLVSAPWLGYAVLFNL